MTAGEFRDIVRRTAEITGWTEIVIIGSQAIHGTLEDPDIAVVMLSNDVDLYPKHGYTSDAVWERLLYELGQDSDFHIETLNYVESVPVELARFPGGWEDRAISQTLGTITIGGISKILTVIFPEIHDLTVAKLAVPENRTKDIEFLPLTCEPLRRLRNLVRHR